MGRYAAVACFAREFACGQQARRDLLDMSCGYEEADRDIRWQGRGHRAKAVVPERYESVVRFPSGSAR